MTETMVGVIGVDTHRDTHTAAALTGTGGVLAERRESADSGGFRRLYDFGVEYLPDARRWAIEGTGSYGAGLTRFLVEQGEEVVEVERPKRPARRSHAKSDELDAIRAARQALADDGLSNPKQGSAREALRVLLATRKGALSARVEAINLLKGLIVTAPEEIRDQLRGLSTRRQVAVCAKFRARPSGDVAMNATVQAMRSAASRIVDLDSEARCLESTIAKIVDDTGTNLTALPGIGPISAARVIVAWSHPGRFRSEAAFAALAGVSPIEASSGQTTRHRLNRGGDRLLNAAIHTIVLVRLRADPETKAYAARRTLQGKSSREIRRCLKRYVARQLHRHLTAHPPAT